MGAVVADERLRLDLGQPEENLFAVPKVFGETSQVLAEPDELTSPSPSTATVGLAIQFAQLIRRRPPDCFLQPGQSTVGVQFGPGLENAGALPICELR